MTVDMGMYCISNGQKRLPRLRGKTKNMYKKYSYKYDHCKQAALYLQFLTYKICIRFLRIVIPFNIR